MGAQHESDTGNLVASYMLEHAFSGFNIEQIFVRPAYYYSNWAGYLELVKTQGILPTFFPPEMVMPMISTVDVAEFLAAVMIQEAPQERIYEICGPCDYSALDIAKIFENVLNRDVALQQILPDEWESTLEQAGFTADGAKNLMLMTQAVIDGKTKCETINTIRLLMDLRMYLEQTL